MVLRHSQWYCDIRSRYHLWDFRHCLRKSFSAVSEPFANVAFGLAKLFFIALGPIVWLHYLFLAIRCFRSAITIEGTILGVVQLIAVTVYIFAAAHYYVALFSDDPAYHGIENPKPEFGWEWHGDFEDRLIFRPPLDTVVDFVYFSTTTTATVGYGDIYPISRMSKIVTIAQIAVSFGLIAVILGWVIGHTAGMEKNSGRPQEQDRER
jgi:hypothetical protein